MRPFPNVDSTRITVSRAGGIGPLWARSGRELFFVDPDTRDLMAAQFDTDSGQVLAPETLFTMPPGYLVNAGWNFYDVASDDQRFLMVRPYVGEGDESATELILVQNFFEVLKERVGGGDDVPRPHRPPERRPGRPLQDRANARRGRYGHRVPGGGPQARPEGGPEGPEAGTGCHRRGRTVPRRDQGHGEPPAPSHPAAVRLG